MEIITVDFDPKHMNLIETAADDPDVEMLDFMQTIDERALEYSKAGPCRTLLEESGHHAIAPTILAVGGVVYLWEGVGELWLMVSPSGRKCKKALWKFMSDFCEDCMGQYKFHRIQASVVVGHRDSHRTMLHLGFIPEGMMAHYGPNRENYIRYVRLRG